MWKSDVLSAGQEAEDYFSSFQLSPDPLLSLYGTESSDWL